MQYKYFKTKKMKTLFTLIFILSSITITPNKGSNDIIDNPKEVELPSCFSDCHEKVLQMQEEYGWSALQYLWFVTACNQDLFGGAQQ